MRPLAILLASTLACASLDAQSLPQMKSTSRDSRAVVEYSSTIQEMQSALRNLITSEEKYWSTHGTYTTEGSALDIFPTKSGQPSVQVVFAGSRGWTGISTDRSLKGKSCVVYVGIETELPGGVPKTMAGVAAKEEGVPTCDVP